MKTREQQNEESVMACQHTKTFMGSCMSSKISQTSGQLYAPTALPREKRPGIYVRFKTDVDF